MIECISLANVATFGAAPERLDGLREINFLFGANGTGKTTISRVISNETNYATCAVSWKSGTKLQPLIYNRDFVEANFHQAAELKGVFTLGEKHHDTLAKIAAAKADLDVLTAKIANLSETLQGVDGNGGKKGELAALQATFRQTCWAQKQKHDLKFQGCFEGFRGSQEKFKSKVLEEQVSNAAALICLADLEKKAESVFGSTPTTEASIANVDATAICAHETNPILRRRVIGKDDVDIAAMIKKLGNSDWVREGRDFFNANKQVCPFCQQATNEAFARSLNEYFDETFVADSRAIDDLVANYATDAARIQQQLAALIASPSRFLDVEKLKTEKELFDAKVILNNQRLSGKKKEASQVVELESLNNVCTAIKTLIDATNTQIAAHNKMVENLATERATLTSQVWRFVLEELKNDLAAFGTTKERLDKAIGSISAAILATTKEKTAKAAEIRELEKQTTSIQPTIDGINGLLSSFGFEGFKLAKAASGASYKLVRSDGSDAKATLSEGEKTFVTFLYFYHLLKGSDSDSGMTANRIVVFDDPVSSLDSDVLFIVSTLIKGVFEEVRTDVGHIKQVFVLTHNVYFHKEVTFNPKRKVGTLKDETFWIVRRFGLVTRVEKHDSNPIKTSYELLWAEVRKADRSNLSIQNTLRRILENYFKILGGFEFDNLCSMFEGKEKLVCKSLCSWIHDGSHYAHDDIFVSIDDATVETYLRVFRAIFKKAGHEAHYRMMMGEAYVEDATRASGVDNPATSASEHMPNQANVVALGAAVPTT